MQQGASREQAKRRALPTPHKYAWLCVAVPNTALSVNRPRGHSSEGESVGGLQRSGGLMECSVGAQRNTASHQTETECSPAKSVARTHVLPTEGDTHEQARSKQGASKAEGFAHTAQITRAVYPLYLRAACLQMPFACRAASGGRRWLSFKQDGSRGKILSLRTRIRQTYSELIWWFCHSHGDTTVSPKRRILVIILLSSCYHLAFIFKVFVCFCNVFLFCYVFLLLFIGVFLTKYH